MVSLCEDHINGAPGGRDSYFTILKETNSERTRDGDRFLV